MTVTFSLSLKCTTANFICSCTIEKIDKNFMVFTRFLTGLILGQRFQFRSPINGVSKWITLEWINLNLMLTALPAPKFILVFSLYLVS